MPETRAAFADALEKMTGFAVVAAGQTDNHVAAMQIDPSDKTVGGRFAFGIVIGPKTGAIEDCLFYAVTAPAKCYRTATPEMLLHAAVAASGRVDEGVTAPRHVRRSLKLTRVPADQVVN